MRTHRQNHRQNHRQTRQRPVAIAVAPRFSEAPLERFALRLYAVGLALMIVLPLMLDGVGDRAGLRPAGLHATLGR